MKAFYERQPEAGDRNFLVRQGTVDVVESCYIPYDFFAGDKNFHNFNNRKAHIGHRFSHDFGNGFSVEQNLRYSQYSDDWKTLVVWYAGEDSDLSAKPAVLKIAHAICWLTTACVGRAIPARSNTMSYSDWITPNAV
ncbi:hypothetical protein ACFPVS_06405 [Neisseria weixii]|uniref:hypothetical protein n=1 Tax=Neisseria weixii TaxID=1853276 RepID=UPI000F4F93AE|nr:hypothetical protein [Neisseria weixii]